MNPTRRAPTAALVLLLAAPVAVAQLPADQQAEMAINAAKRMYNDGHLPAARDAFRQFLQKFGGDRRATDARYGLGLCALNAPDPDFASAVEPLTQAAGDGGHPDRGRILYHLAVAHRGVALRDANAQSATGKFNDAARRFAEARDWFAGKKTDDWAGRCRCDQAEAELRAGRPKDARATVEPFTKDAALRDNKHRPLGLYYHGLVCFQDRDLNAAGRSLNQLAPFNDPVFGTHARYLVGRVLHLQGESAEAAVHYDAVLAAHAKANVKSPPEYVAGATFHGACLNYEAGKFADALAKFRAFEATFPASPLVPDAQLRVGFCLVQLKQFDDAGKLLGPLPDRTPRLADQALFWLGKSKAATDPAAAAELFRKAADKANQAVATDPDAKARRGEALLELGDALSGAKRHPDAAKAYEQVWNERLLPDRRNEEVIQRLAAAWGAAGDLNRSDQWCNEHRQKFPQGTLTPAVLFRTAENGYARAAAAKPADERKQRLDDAAKKFREVIDRYPEFERVSHARYALGVCLAQAGDLEAAVKALDAIPAPDRGGDLSAAAYLLADCLIRLAPAKADDALAENIIREKLTAASGLLENYVASNPKAADAPDAVLKLGHCLKRLGSTLADANERNQLLNKAREFYEKLAKDYPQTPQAWHARLEIAKVRALAGDRGGAMNDLRQFASNPEAQKSPVAPLALLALATLHREQSQVAEAAKVLEDARKRYDGGEWAHLLKYHHGVALAEAGKLPEARQLLDEVAAQARDQAVGSEAALRAGQVAVTIARKLPKEADQRAAVRQAAERLERWADEFRQAMPAGEPRARMLYDAAWAYRSLPDAEPRAVNAYKRLADEFPDLAMAVDARFEWAELLAEKGDHPAAIKLLREAIDKEPTDRATSPELLDRVRLRLGGSLYAAKDYKGARTQFETVAGNDKSPHRPQAMYRAAEAALAAGDHAAAAEKLKPFRDDGRLHNVPGVSDRAVLRLGQSYLSAKNWDAARQAFEVALQRYGNSPFAADARYGLGWGLQSQGKYDEAVGQYEQVTRLTAAEVAAKAQAQIGLCRAAQKRYPEAAAALMMVPYTYDYPELGYAAVLEAARAFDAAGQPEQAAKVLRRLLQDAPADGEWAKAAKERLEKK